METTDILIFNFQLPNFEKPGFDYQEKLIAHYHRLTRRNNYKNEYFDKNHPQKSILSFAQHGLKKIFFRQ